jgi:membrane-associated HD superfamily phosphohydrolase
MIVDSIEATSRSIFNSGETEDKFIKEAINSTIERLVDDGQLDNMKIGTLKVVKKILFKELESIYHKRVTYESQKTIGDAKAENNIEVENL